MCVVKGGEKLEPYVPPPPPPPSAEEIAKAEEKAKAEIKDPQKETLNDAMMATGIYI